MTNVEEGAYLGGGKRRLPSPEGAVKQAALPQPHTGRERREEEEEEQWRVRGWGDGTTQSSESHMLQERQEQGGHLREEVLHPDSRRSRTLSGGKKRSDGFSCFRFITSPKAADLMCTECDVLIFEKRLYTNYY